MRELIAEMSSEPMVNLTSANKHVLKIQKPIWLVNERCRTTRHIISFMRLPIILNINIVSKNVKLLGCSPTTDVSSTTISPRAIMADETLNYKRHLAITFGQNYQIHEEETPRKNTRPLTRGSICMGNRGKNQGEFELTTLGSMKKVVRQIFYKIPMPDTMIA